MYLSKRHLAKREGIDREHANFIWRKYYFIAWGSPATIILLVVFFLAVLLLEFPYWLIASGVLLIHIFLAIPIASKKMKKSIDDTARNNE